MTNSHKPMSSASIWILTVVALVSWGCLDTKLDLDFTDDVPAQPGDAADKDRTIPEDDSVPSSCGNGICDQELGESSKNCMKDCCKCGDNICAAEAPCLENMKNCDVDCCVCGNGVCDMMECGENWMVTDPVEPSLLTCATDCASCGNGTCDPSEGPSNCSLDCCGGCGDGKCMGAQCQETPEDCPQDCNTFACGNAVCEAIENPLNCPQDCEKFACGNGTCDPAEDDSSCPQDCGATCGDCNCGGDETFETCPQDCGFCGDGYCIGACEYIWEDEEVCPQDCCVPDCTDRECGDDGCGGSCGECGEGLTCDENGACA
jgi:hypothetical protein